MVTPEQAAANYAAACEGKPFYEGLVSYITSGPVVKMVVSGEGAVAKCRSLMGATNPADAAPGTIRGDFGLVMDENVIHGSDSRIRRAGDQGYSFRRPNGHRKSRRCEAIWHRILPLVRLRPRSPAQASCAGRDRSVA